MSFHNSKLNFKTGMLTLMYAAAGTLALTPARAAVTSTSTVNGVRETFDTYRFPFDSQERPRISLRFGSHYDPVLKRRLMHDGIDIPKPNGTPVFPARSGSVLTVDWNEEYGQLITIKHNNGETTRYGHLSKVMVKPGDLVQRGKTIIGLVGSTGISNGSQLHFELRDRNGRPVNPVAKIGRR